MKKIIKLIGIISLISSYLILIWNFKEYGFRAGFNQLFDYAWLFGVISLIINSIYAILIDLDKVTFSIFGTCGLIWIAPFVIDMESLSGFPSLIIYLIIGIHIHIKKNKNSVQQR
ncbi:hypothetical protein P8625_06005 [Tenacibaculum tangerinum]|uniref:Uncharacterized protein n=1 Tax=Tenacibaculum tangerinum TaxID=3038772 RepID=A0ABY8L5M1_9FLAO|nr:hypothetical protein [Tenacibaculum tangerinum]WGH76707.1 hypothetical protein P8625_06005 [Tenacibaculum tangerinum]